jgi:hypothetical protein
VNPFRPSARGSLTRALARLAAALAAVLLLAPAARAEPRWWWDDVAIGPIAEASDVDVAVVARPGEPSVVLVAWVEPPLFFEGALRLTASFDGGCSFCPPVHLESLFGPDDDIALAAAAFDGVTPTIAITVAHAVAGRVQVLHDATALPLDGADGCAALLQLNLVIGRTQLSDGDGDSPDVEGVANPASGRTEFHAVWHQIAPTDEEWILHARDLAGDGSAWEAGRPLPTSAGLFVRQAGPRVSLDLFSGATDAAVNVAWSVPEFNQVLYARSVDSGTTFSATGESPEGPPATVAQAGLGLAGPVAIDSGASADGTEPPWHGVAMFQDRGPAALVVADAQHQEGPALPGPAWDVDPVLSDAGSFRDDGLATSVLPGGPAGEPQPWWSFWTAPVFGGGREIVARGAVLDSDAAVPVDVDSPAFPPVRPDDPTVSATGTLTNCRTEPGLGECVSERISGSARAPATADDGTDVYLAWLDDRDGQPTVWFKRTDRSVAPPSPSLTTSCPAPDERRITVGFDQLPRCSSPSPVPETMGHYLVYYGTTAGGPYENTDLDASDPAVPDTIVLMDDGTLTDPVTVDIDGLAAGTQYFVIVVPEDRAANTYPADFDPLAARGASPENEASITTPVTCGPCPALEWTEGLVATPGECAIDLTWNAAAGAEPVLYDVLRDGLEAATGLSATSWTDSPLPWNEPHEYRVVARDSCADPGPQEITSAPTPMVAAVDTVPPLVEPDLSLPSPCEVQLAPVLTDGCSGPTALVDVLRDGFVIATEVTLPHVDVVPGNGTYAYELRVQDQAGNEALRPAGSIDVADCEVPGPCLFRATADSLDATGLFVSPRGANDIAFAPPHDLSYGPCPFGNGDTDPEVVLGAAAPPLIYYQVEGSGVELHVTAEPALGTVRLSWD